MSALAEIRVFSVDDHPLLHEGLATVIRNQPDMVLAGRRPLAAKPSAASASAHPISRSWICGFRI